MPDMIYYAIGDIHGQAESLSLMHRRISYRHDRDFAGRAGTIVHLGDYVDRGPDSYDVIEQIMTLEKESPFKVVSLKGNHEQLMLEGCKADPGRTRSEWLRNGGDLTLQSYQAFGFDAPCDHHLAWMENLPSIYWDQEAKYIFVHAGVDPRSFPNEGDNIRLWTRSRAFFNPEKWESPALEDMTVIHGHTPTETGEPDLAGFGRRINVDTGACYGGPLTAAVLVPGQPPEFLQV